MQAGPRTSGLMGVFALAAAIAENLYYRADARHDTTQLLRCKGDAPIRRLHVNIGS